MPATSKCVVYVATHCVGTIATLDPLCNLGRKVYTSYYLLNSFHKSGYILCTYIYIYDFENEISAMLTFSRLITQRLYTVYNCLHLLLHVLLFCSYSTYITAVFCTHQFTGILVEVLQKYLAMTFSCNVG